MDDEAKIRADLRIRAAAFRAALEELEQRFQITLSHQDSQGAFLYEDATMGGFLHEDGRGTVVETGPCSRREFDKDDKPMRWGQT